MKRLQLLIDNKPTRLTMNRGLITSLAFAGLLACDERTPPAVSTVSPPSHGIAAQNGTTSIESPHDLEILELLSRVDVARIASDIQHLVGFETRNTCSDNSGSAPGIGAARDWIQGQLAALPGVEVRLDPWTYTGCGNSRTLHNVIAWIPGT